MSLSHDQELFAHNVSTLIIFVFGQGYTCTLGESFRTKEQAELYAKSGKGIADSQHCKRLAIDLNIISPNGTFLTDSADYEPFGIFWEKLCKQNRWGGRFHDHLGKP